VRIDDRLLFVQLSGGRSVSVPLEWYPRLADASPEERTRWEFTGPGLGVHWPELDEDISVEGLLRGRRSAESARSLSRWRQARKQRAKTRPQARVGARRAH